MSDKRYLFTSESVSMGHPDKLADQISDAVLDAMLSKDPASRVACETLVTTGAAVVAGEVTTKAQVDIPKVVREAVLKAGYDCPSKGFDGKSCSVNVLLGKQSPDIARGVGRKKKKAQAMKAPQPIFGSQFQPVNQPRKPYQWLIDSGLIEIEAMTFIRGRSIGHAFMIVDEAQNMTPHEAKTVITRIGEGSKLVLIGDLDQVDTPYLDGKSNGLIHTHERMKGHAITANVRLLHGVRSALSELAAQAM